MILLNTTFYIHPSLTEEFSTWVKEQYLPSALGSGLYDASLSRIMADVGEDVTGYAMHLYCDSLEEAERWHDGTGAAVRETFLSRYGQKALFFSTYMEVLPL
ncbi:DUF4286 family protein [uncultured Duncaniella sp.]|uniref:DUF4286 family protein n=1 Tax=uncultured Duncaniella sp. TaxID=2768039 RepID=UPI00261DB118|nr:DUF4286 family protein [uncultured Duncaniella sp.]